MTDNINVSFPKDTGTRSWKPGIYNTTKTKKKDRKRIAKVVSTAMTTRSRRHDDDDDDDDVEKIPNNSNWDGNVGKHYLKWEPFVEHFENKAVIIDDRCRTILAMMDGYPENHQELERVDIRIKLREEIRQIVNKFVTDIQRVMKMLNIHDKGFVPCDLLSVLDIYVLAAGRLSTTRTIRDNNSKKGCEITLEIINYCTEGIRLNEMHKKMLMNGSNKDEKESDVIGEMERTKTIKRFLLCRANMYYFCQKDWTNACTDFRAVFGRQTMSQNQLVI